MSNVATVEVTGAAGAEAVARLLARSGATAELSGDRWEVKGWSGASLFVEDEEPDDGYAVAVDVWAPDSDEATEAAVHDVYDLLAARTAWGLRRLDFWGSTVASRPAVSRAS